jgi:hypothetical protein
MTNVTRDDLLAQCACFDLRKVTRAVTWLYRALELCRITEELGCRA